MRPPGLSCATSAGGTLRRRGGDHDAVEGRLLRPARRSRRRCALRCCRSRVLPGAPRACLPRRLDELDRCRPGAPLRRARRPGSRSRCRPPAPRAAASGRADRSRARRCTAARWSGRCRSAADGCGRRVAAAPAGTRRWRSTLPMRRAHRRRHGAQAGLALVSAYMASTSATMRARARRGILGVGFAERGTKPEQKTATRAFVFLDQRVGAVVVDRLEVLRLDHVARRCARRG